MPSDASHPKCSGRETYIYMDGCRDTKGTIQNKTAVFLCTHKQQSRVSWKEFSKSSCVLKICSSAEETPNRKVKAAF